MNKKAENEKQRMMSLLDVSESRMGILEPIIANTAWMKTKLDETIKEIKSSKIVIPYDNGGGQQGTRENPLFKAYESLWKSYMQGMTKILEALPPEIRKQEEEKAEEPKTVLQIVRAKHKGTA